MYGYGGFTYHARFWSGVVQDFLSEYDVPLGGTVLDIGCAKGFMLVDFSLARPDLRVTGVDISAYAISHADPRVLTSLMQADAQSLPLASGSVDLAISINTLHNLAGSELVRAFGEIERVSRGNAFVMVDAFETEAEEQAMRDWVLTAKTVMHCDQWIDFFDEVGYSGDFDFWTVT
jgi:ubiquinone/menaquinone biosynthesis C-methylase UbiE